MTERAKQEERESSARRVRLTRSAIVRAGIEIADESGLAAISMRSVAARLGSGTMSLYRHISGSDELISLMIDQIHSEYDYSGTVARSSREVLEKTARLDMRLYRSHAWMVSAALATRPSIGPGMAQNMEWTLSALDRYGVPRLQAYQYVMVVATFTQGVAALHNDSGSRRGGRNTADPDEALSWWRNQVQLISAESAGAYPCLEATLQEEVGDFDAVFEVGLQVILDGIDRAGSAGAGADDELR